MRTLLCVALWIVFGPHAGAEVFTYEFGGRQFEAEVSQEVLTLRAKGENAAADITSLACPLGSAVRANVIPAGESGSKVCLVFSKQQCNYDDARAGSPRGVSGSFRCIDFADARQAEALATLVNAGPRPEGSQETVAPAAAAPATSAPVAAPARSASRTRAKSGTANRKQNGSARASTDKSAAKNRNAQSPRSSAAPGPTPTASDRSDGESRPADKRGSVRSQALPS